VEYEEAKKIMDVIIKYDCRCLLFCQLENLLDSSNFKKMTKDVHVVALMSKASKISIV